jgi:hypothetical protein
MATSSVSGDGQPHAKKARLVPQALETTLANAALRIHFYPSARQASSTRNSGHKFFIVWSVVLAKA